MVKMTFTDNSKAFDYAIYEIVGSYFKKAKLVNSLQEQNMCVSFCEQKLDNQYIMEETCISYIENHLMKELPADLWDEEVSVVVKKDAEDGKGVVRFVSPKYVLSFKGDYKGKKSKLSYRLCQAA